MHTQGTTDFIFASYLLKNWVKNFKQITKQRYCNCVKAITFDSHALTQMVFLTQSCECLPCCAG